MTKTQAKLRQAFGEWTKAHFTISKKELDKIAMNEKLFCSTLQILIAIEKRRDMVEEQIGIDMTTYEDPFFNVIENLLNMVLSKKQIALIHQYIYHLIPDQEWDGLIEIPKSETEVEKVNFRTPQEVWKVIQKIK